jgi:serine protease Do
MLTTLTLDAQQDAAGVYKQAKDAVVLIQGEHRIGTGVIVSAAGWVVTNYHVVSGERSVTIRFASGLELPATDLVASDPDADIAILKLSGTGFSHLDLGDSDSLAVGQRIFVISNPMGLQGTVTEGLVSAVRQVRGAKMLQISAPISPGSSGGPVFDQSARVVGIATATIEGAQNLNLAIPASAIRTLLRKPQEVVKLSDLASPRTDEQAVSQVAPILRNVNRYLGNEMIDEAEAQLRAGIQNFEFNPVLRLELAKLLIRTGRTEEALQQLRVTSKLTPDNWQAVALMGDLYLQKWLKDGRLSDRQLAHQAYSELLKRPTLPPAKRDAYQSTIQQMRSPVGQWATTDGRKFEVIAKSEGGFSMTVGTLGEFEPYRPGMSLDAYADRYLSFDAEFHDTFEQGKFAGTSSFLDTACGYEQAVKVEVRPDGSTMDIRGTISRITSIRRSMIDTVGKQRAQEMCKRPGDSGSSLWLTRLRAKEYFVYLEWMLEADTQPLAFGER